VKNLANLSALVLATIVSFAAPARADELGGHVGIAFPLMSVDAHGATGIGKDFFTVSVPIGITYHLSERWAVDLEAVVSNELMIRPSPATGFTVDPGVLYTFGQVIVGGRVASHVGPSANVGVIPLVCIPGVVAWERVVSFFVEIDAPVWLAPSPSFGLQLHMGVGF